VSNNNVGIFASFFKLKLLFEEESCQKRDRVVVVMVNEESENRENCNGSSQK
jgi:hypothetical protein